MGGVDFMDQNVADILFNVLQKKSIDIIYCANKLDQTKKLIAGKRNEAVFNKYFEEAEKRTPVKLKRTIEVKSKSEFVNKYKVLYFEIQDVIINYATQHKIPGLE